MTSKPPAAVHSRAHNDADNRTNKKPDPGSIKAITRTKNMRHCPNTKSLIQALMQHQQQRVPPSKRSVERHSPSLGYTRCKAYSHTSLQYTEIFRSLRSPNFAGKSLVCPSSFFRCFGHTGFL